MGTSLALVSLGSPVCLVVLLLPALVFLLFLVSRVQASVRKLLQCKSHIMSTYYVFLWVITILNLLWCVLQLFWQAKPATQATAWNVMSLVTRFGMVLLEVNVVVFLSQGYLIRGWNALLANFTVFRFFASVDASVKVPNSRLTWISAVTLFFMSGLQTLQF